MVLPLLLVAVLLVPGGRCSGTEDSPGLLLLQKEARLRPALDPSKPFIHANPALPDDGLFWNLRPQDQFEQQGPDSCSLRFVERAFWGSATQFAFGQCPLVLQGERRPVRLGLDLLQDGTTAPGYNPSLIPLPDALRAAVPDGRWLAALRVGDELWITSPCQASSDIRMSDAARAAMPSGEQIIGASIGVEAVINETSAEQDRLFRHLPRSFLAIFDEDFELLAKTKIAMRNKESVLDEASIQDVRLVQLESGELLIGYHPNYLMFGHHAGSQPGSTLSSELIAELHVEVGDHGLEAWLDKRMVRQVKECPELDLRAPGGKHNMGFFQSHRVTYGVDWVYPTKVGRLNLTELKVPRELAGGFPPLCFGYEGEAPPLRASPWEGLETLTVSTAGVTLEKVRPHNGAPLVFLPETGEYLGIGHVERKFIQFGAPLPWYSQQFFTLKGDPARGRPFQLHRLSQEVCFESAARPGDCDRVQLASSLLRAGDLLQVGYGVMDCEGFVVDLLLEDVLRLLRDV